MDGLVPESPGDSEVDRVDGAPGGKPAGGEWL